MEKTTVQYNPTARKASNAYDLIRFITETLQYSIIEPTELTKINTGTHLILECTVCKAILLNKRVCYFTRLYKLHGTRGCANCNNIQKPIDAANTVTKLIAEIEANTGMVLVGTLPSNRKAKSQFQSTVCSHTFLSTLDNLLANEPTKCPKCSRIDAIAKIRATGDKIRAANIRQHPTLAAYNKSVRSCTEATWRRSASIINPNQFIRTHPSKKSGHHLDHILPVRLCYDLRLSPEIVGSAENLQMLDWKLNIELQEYIDRKLIVQPEIVKRATESINSKLGNVLIFGATGITATTEYQSCKYYIEFPYLQHKAANKNAILSQQEFVNRITMISPTLTVIGNYVNSYTKIEMSCSNNHKWSAKPNDLQKGHGCPICARMKVAK